MTVSAIQALETAIAAKASELMNLQERICSAQEAIEESIKAFGKSQTATTQASDLAGRVKDLRAKLGECDKLLTEKEAEIAKYEAMSPELISLDYLYRLRTNYLKVLLTAVYHEQAITGTGKRKISKVHDMTHEIYTRRLNNNPQLRALHMGSFTSSVRDRIKYVVGWSCKDRGKGEGYFLPFPDSHPEAHGWVVAKSGFATWVPPS